VSEWISKCFECGGECTYQPVDAATAARYREAKAIDATADDDDRPELDLDREPNDDEPREHKIGKSGPPPQLVRLETGEAEIDYVTGGGYVGSKLYGLVGPEGTGKSRIGLKSACRLCKIGHTLYISTSGEEGADDVERHVIDSKLDRLSYVKQRLHYYEECDDADFIVSLIEKHDPVYVVLDSISTLYSERAPGIRGSSSQMSYAMYRFRKALKLRPNCAMLALFQLTSDGKVAGGAKPAYMFDTMLETTRMAWTPPSRTVDYDADGNKSGREIPGKWMPTEEPTPFFRLRPTGKSRHAPPTNAQIFRLTLHSIEAVNGDPDGKTSRATKPKKKSK
jgi:predicted ATP-dependent serine protease